MTTITAVINARTKSTRLPNKVLRPFADTTIIDVALDKLNQMDFVEDRLFAVAEEELILRGEQYSNVNILKRDPASIEKGHPPLGIRFAYLNNIQTDYILLVNPCHPFITLETLKKSVDTVREGQCNSYTSVVSSSDWIFDGDGDPITNRNPSIVSTNQNVSNTKAAHAFHYIRPDFFRSTGKLWTFEKNDPACITIPEIEALDIDTPLDFEICELLYAKRKKTGSLTS